MVGAMIFLAIGGDAWMLRGLAAPSTRSRWPIASEAADRRRAAGVLGDLRLRAGDRRAGDAGDAIADVALGVVSRVVPQLNVFAVGFPVKIGVGLIVIATMPFIGGWMPTS